MTICQLCIRVRGSAPLRLGVFRTRPGNPTTEIYFVTRSSDLTPTLGLQTTNNPPFVDWNPGDVGNRWRSDDTGETRRGYMINCYKPSRASPRHSFQLLIDDRTLCFIIRWAALYRCSPGLAQGLFLLQVLSLLYFGT